MPMPRSKPSRMTYIATAVPMTAAQITGRYHSISAHLLEGIAAPGGCDRTTPCQWWFGGRGVGTCRDQPVDVINPHRKNDSVDKNEQRKRCGDAGTRHRRDGVSRP